MSTPAAVITVSDRSAAGIRADAAGPIAVAALRTVEGRLAHSLHAYFLRPGDSRVPTIFEVDRVRDGGTFTTRLVAPDTVLYRLEY